MLTNKEGIYSARTNKSLESLKKRNSVDNVEKTFFKMRKTNLEIG